MWTATRCSSRAWTLAEVYQTLQTFMGGYFVNYFNRFGRQWQVYVEAEGKYRSRAWTNIGLFYVRNKPRPERAALPPSTSMQRIAPGRNSSCTTTNTAARKSTAAPPPATVRTRPPRRWRMSSPKPCRPEMGFDYFGMSFQEQQAAQGVPRIAIFGLSLAFVFLILAALYESWSLPFSVLISTPVAVLGAFLALCGAPF